LGVGIIVEGTDAMVEDALEGADSVTNMEKLAVEGDMPDMDSLASYVVDVFQTNRDAKQDSGIEDEIISSRRAYNGEYDDEDLQKIQAEGGSSIFMNITALKAKAARSWILDILLPPQERAWILSPSPLPELPMEISKQIEESIQRDFQEKKEQAATPPPVPESATPPSPTAPPIGAAQQAQESLKEMNQQRRDIYDAVFEEIKKEARFQLRKMEIQVDDQLKEGKWDAALSDFVTDFTIYPTAFMKGPVITNGKKIKWENGEAVVVEDFIYLNKRVDPLDVYPSPSATTIQEGSFIEHIRLSASELTSLKGIDGYDTDRINDVLAGNTGSWFTMDDSIEDEKSDLEKRGDYISSNNDVIHGLHFFGAVKVETLREWGLILPKVKVEDEELGVEVEVEEYEDNDVVETEIILVGGQVIKAKLNDDPLLKRPYYKASFIDLPGAFWGRSLPMMMRDTQRMCNAVARALANNLGMSSGLQVYVNVDRLADDGPIDEIVPRKIWQVKNDPAGGSAKPIEFFQPTSNANELLAVFQKFEERADDVTGIPRWAYGNDPNTAGGRPTVGGLSLMLESATKVIKDAIRNIDMGLIQPRIECQFYYNLVTNPDNKYTGDVNVIPRGSSALTIKAAQQIRRNELLQATANPYDQTLIGPAARAEILREIGKDLGMDSNIIPSAIDVKRNVEKAQAQQEAMAQQPQAPDNSMQIVQMQTQAMAQVAQMQAEMKKMTLEFEAHKEQAKLEQKKYEADLRAQVEQMKLQLKAQTSAATNQVAVENKNKDVAVKLRNG